MNDEWAYRWATTPADVRQQVWRSHRIDEIAAGRTPRSLATEPTMVVHVFPPTAFNGSVELPRIEIGRLAETAWLHPATIRANIDGIAAIGKEHTAYVQIFRDGIIEYASSDLISAPHEQAINREAMEEFLIAFLHNVTRLMCWTNEERAYAVTLLRMADHCLPQTPANLGFDRDTILVPSITDAEPVRAGHKILQLIRQANGQRTE